MRTRRFLLSVIAVTVFTAGFMWSGARAGAAQSVLALDGDVSPVHDPVVIREKGTYYVFCTGGRSGQGVLPIRTSADMRTWKAAGFVFESLPEWVGKEVPMARNAWAPDISFFNGNYHLYYSVSSFGSRNSAIGLATTRRSTRRAPTTAGQTRAWSCGRIRTRTTGTPSIPTSCSTTTEPGSRGAASGAASRCAASIRPRKALDADTTLHSLCSRPREQPINGSVEAPFIVRHGDYWYLFVSFDRCCRGAQSTYNIVVGRSRS